MTTCDKAVAILQATDDGRRLYQTPEQVERYGANGDGWQLSLIQHAVNGHLKPSGMLIFEALYKQVTAGDYLYPIREFVHRFCPEAEL